MTAANCKPFITRLLVETNYAPRRFSAEGEAERVMRILLLILVVSAAGIYVDKPAQAQGGGWCAYLNMGGHGGARNCGFATLQQCLATVSGIGGSCSPSPYYERPNYRRYRPGYPY
jgi:hypothetical protein